MQTPSHALLTWFLGDRLRGRVPVHVPAAVAGAVAPDVPLFFLTLWFFAVPRRRLAGEVDDEMFGPLYDGYFFHDPVWIASHNFLHAPLLLLTGLLAGWWAHRRGMGWGFPLVWFVLGCGLHSFIDTFTHHNDGPLLLFPFDWSFRFESPVSYWHPDYYGGIFLPLEWTMNLLILGYFGRRWLDRRRTLRGVAPPP